MRLKTILLAVRYALAAMRIEYLQRNGSDH